jgi:competence protein ComEA
MKANQQNVLRIAAAFCAVFTLLLGGLAAADGRGVSMIKADTQSKNRTAAGVYVISINTATRQEFEMLEGIGPVLAERIVAFREKNSGFKTVEDLLKIEGIGPKTLEKNLHHLLI